MQTDPGVIRYIYTSSFELIEKAATAAASGAAAGGIGKALISNTNYSQSLGPGLALNYSYYDQRIE